jgi:hypothetical protein
MTYLDAHSDWTFDLKVFRTYLLSGREAPCPEPSDRIRRPQGDDFLVYEVLNVVEHDVSRSVWQVEVRLVEKQREVELTLPTEEDEGCQKRSPFELMRSKAGSYLKEAQSFMRNKTG